ncbi:helix-hairpin-helix domain-containing protein [Aestuariirhabdus litorea]|uniref:Helix-hairpin-helix domain-containing protein n=2 Tax=Aestuariirhabdus litorea TaxID=2528527 RepID=A0A3P3VTY0_9GAMM|nr:helix-hairpin-helix domain-containing protein [Aestuariirhabdus litorea]RWW98661.1 helix-hairpin-helix domain-containing protein [Endozoicomonadaceae bacterium GTF-13]
MAWAASEPTPGTTAVATEAVAMPTINLNTADAQTIADNLTGIGLTKAQAIVAYRDKHGAFVALEELTAVKGIGEKTLAKNAERIRLQ